MYYNNCKRKKGAPLAGSTFFKSTKLTLMYQLKSKRMPRDKLF